MDAWVNALELLVALSLDAPSHLYIWVCPSVGPSVRPSIRPSVRPTIIQLWSNLSGEAKKLTESNE